MDFSDEDKSEEHKEEKKKENITMFALNKVIAPPIPRVNRINSVCEAMTLGKNLFELNINHK